MGPTVTRRRRPGAAGPSILLQTSFFFSLSKPTTGIVSALLEFPKAVKPKSVQVAAFPSRHRLSRTGLLQHQMRKTEGQAFSTLPFFHPAPLGFLKAVNPKGSQLTAHLVLGWTAREKSSPPPGPSPCNNPFGLSGWTPCSTSVSWQPCCAREGPV
jgi:hypothetical protein